MTEKEREMAATTTYGVTGMTCGHCVSAVQTEVGRLAGVREVDRGAGRGRDVHGPGQQ